MAAPDYVPPSLADQPRSSVPLPPPRRWTASRPGDLQRGQPGGRGLGRPGPDQGYALNLAQYFDDKLRLAPNEQRHDVVAGGVAVALRRAGRFGRAPVKQDLEFAFGLFGYLDDAPSDLIEFRHERFRGAGHEYWEQRAIVDLIPDSSFLLTPTEVRSRLGDWRRLLGVDGS